MWKFRSPGGTEATRLLSNRWSSTLPPISVGWREVEVSYCSSKNRPALEATCVVIDLVLVRVSKMKEANDSFLDRGVEE